MFVIKNITETEVILDDLRVILGPGKQIDLDRIAARYVIDSSIKLQMAFKHKKVITIAKDGEVIFSENADQLKDMEERIKAEMIKQMHSLRAQTRPVPTNNATEMDKINQTLQELLKKVSAGGAAPSTNTTQTTNPAPAEADIPDDIAAKIHAKAVKRIAEKAEGNIEQEAQKKDGADLAKNLDELEGLF